MTSINNNIMFKICLFGSENSGKSYFLSNISQSPKVKSTKSMGIKFVKHQVLKNKNNYSMLYWDICKKKSDPKSANIFIKSVDIIILFYNPKYNNLNDLKYWSSVISSKDANVYVVVSKLKLHPISKEILDYTVLNKWKIKSYDLKNYEECQKLEGVIIEENEVKIQDSELISFLNSKFIFTMATIGLGCLLTSIPYIRKISFSR